MEENVSAVISLKDKTDMVLIRNTLNTGSFSLKVNTWISQMLLFRLLVQPVR